METAAAFITILVSHVLEIIAAVSIGFAVIKFVLGYLINYFSKGNNVSNENTRLQFGSSVAVSLELLLGADVLATAVAPSWDDIGKLAAIAVLRTALNYFLEKELRHAKSTSISQ